MIKVKVHIEDENSDLCVIIELNKDNIETLACMIAREKYPFPHKKEYSVEEMEFDNELLLQALSQHDVSGCVHPLSELVSGDEGLFCCKCQKYVRSDAHIH